MLIRSAEVTCVRGQDQSSPIAAWSAHQDEALVGEAGVGGDAADE
jgi:hypothetical protein